MFDDARDKGKLLLTVVAVLLAAATIMTPTLAAGGRAATTSGGSAPCADEIEERRGRTFHLVKRVRFADIVCVKKRAASNRRGKCRGIAILKATAPYLRTTSMRTTGGNQGWCKDWGVEMRGLYYVNWKEKAKGTFCWIEGPAAPDIYRNHWGCGYSSGIGYDVHQVDCWDQRRTGDTRYGWWISVYDKFRVSAVARGLPLHWTYQFHVNLHPTGTQTFYVDD